MENHFQEFSGYHGTLVKPYYWFYPNQDCSKCPYHIKTGEEARVTYKEFYESFGFPYGPTMPESKQLIFYELKDFSRATVQRGHVTNCVASNLHVESILFDNNGYMETLLYQLNSICYITLYANYTPCNEYTHCCISKIYNFLLKYPETRLDIYFSQLYHVDDDFPVSAWNREALKSLGNLWPQVTINPLSGGVWQTLLYSFVKGISSTTLYQPILQSRASADRFNAHRIHLITGIKPYFVDVIPMSKPQEPTHCYKPTQANVGSNSAPHHFRSNSQYAFPLPPIPIIPFPAPQFKIKQETSSKPINVVRHLNMPGNTMEEFELSSFIPNARKINETIITEKIVKMNDKEPKDKKSKKGKEK
ncbi:hypothetical protein GDO86_007582 [Hymenochirus boettgeri]|uniref:C->U-editing enzyme APOBEC-4 n=1 Tax=Hymenochirus boettgeri TaxID=247094 RepID=A0A8T2IYD7_9PIPI|nr:hypothetical protein GDO86_007582 [Hymenochirus boettgeri]